MAIYRLRQDVLIEAWRWTGIAICQQVIDGAPAWVGDAIYAGRVRVVTEPDRVLLVEHDGEMHTMRPGEWLVQLPGRRLETYTAQEFRDLFERVAK